MGKRLIAEAEKGRLGNIRIHHTKEFTQEDITTQVVKYLNAQGYPVRIKADSWERGTLVSDGTASPSVTIVQLDRPFMGWNPYGGEYGTVVINMGIAEVSHPGIRQALTDHFNSLEQKVK